MALTPDQLIQRSFNAYDRSLLGDPLAGIVPPAIPDKPLRLDLLGADMIGTGILTHRPDLVDAGFDVLRRWVLEEL